VRGVLDVFAVVLTCFSTGSVKKSKLTLRKSRRELRRKLGGGGRRTRGLLQVRVKK